MGLFSLIIQSYRKNMRVHKISRKIAFQKPIRTVKDMMKDDSEIWREKLFDLVEQTEALRSVLEKYDGTREDLADIHRRLIVTGAGQYAKGHYVAVSALAFPLTLEYCFKMQCESDTDWREVSFTLIDYFQKGKSHVS